jgi:hypothetical protein
MKHRASLFLAALAVGFLALANCNRGDKVAPEGATIDVAAFPSTITVATKGDSGTSDIIATVSSSGGVPLPEQDVRFSASAGLLQTPSGEPAANVPIRTDNFGNAHVTLTTSTTTTVTARSGGATGTLTLSVVTGNLSSIDLNQESGTGCLDATTTFIDCGGDALCLVAKAVDTNGDPIAGVSLEFLLENGAENSDGDPFDVSFTVQNGTTDASGEVHTRVRIASSGCTQLCSGGKTCSGNIVATLRGGGFDSGPFSFTTDIP